MSALEANVINMFESNVQYRCSECGMTQDATCNCGAPVIVISRKEAITKYDKAHPGEPAGKVAKALGMDQTTVSAYRRARIGKIPILNRGRVNGDDGKSYPVTVKKPTRQQKDSGKTTEQTLARKLESFITIQVTLLDRARIEKKIDKKHKLELIEILQWSADKLLSLAQALDGR